MAQDATGREPRPLPFDPIERAQELWDQRWDASLPMAAATSIMRVQQMLLTRFDAALRPLDLTFARFEALVLLHFSRTGSLPMGKIGERLMVHPTSVTNIVQRLERQGFVARRPNPNDGRGSLATLTPAGLEAMRQGTAALVETGFGLDALGADGQTELFALLRDVRLAARDFDDVGPLANSRTS